MSISPPQRKRQRTDAHVNQIAAHQDAAAVIPENSNNDEAKSEMNPELLKRKKSRDKLDISIKVNRSQTKLLEWTGNLQLANVIIFDEEEFKWWKCDACGFKSKYMVQRSMESHLGSDKHSNKLSDDLKKLERERKERQQQNEAAAAKKASEAKQNGERDYEGDAGNDQIFALNTKNEWHQAVIEALSSLNLRSDCLTSAQMSAINYFHTIHESVLNLSSIKATKCSLRRESLHGAISSAHYHSEPDIEDAIRCLYLAQKQEDDEKMRDEDVAVCFDGNTLRRKAARGFMTKVLHNYSPVEIFCDLHPSMKPPETDWKALQTVDSGKDAFDAVKRFCTTINKPVEKVVSVASDWCGSNSGKHKGAIAFWKKVNPFSSWNWDDEHRLSTVTSTLKKLEYFKKINSFLHDVRSLVYSSTIHMQQFRKVLAVLEEEFATYSLDIEIRFNSILPLLKQILLDWPILCQFVDVFITHDEECQKYAGKKQKYQHDVTAYQRELTVFQQRQIINANHNHNRNQRPSTQQQARNAQQHQRQAPQAIRNSHQHAQHVQPAFRLNRNPQIQRQQMVSSSNLNAELPLQLQRPPSQHPNHSQANQQRRLPSQVNANHQRQQHNTTSNSSQRQHHGSSAPLQQLQQVPTRPIPPTEPKALSVKRRLYNLSLLVSSAILIDYIQLFDNHAKLTGSVNWMKCLTLEQIEQLEISLMKWADQTWQNPKSPHFKAVKTAMTESTQWKYTPQQNLEIKFPDFGVLSLYETIITNNKQFNTSLSQELAAKYSNTERNFMSAERQLIDPVLLHGLCGQVLSNHGKQSLDVLLSFFGVDKDPDGVYFQAIVDAKQTREEYDHWKLYAVKETQNIINLSNSYDRIITLFRTTSIKYGQHYKYWMTIYRRILLNYNSSMSLERVYRTRKLLQDDVSSSYKFEGLNWRLRVYENGPKAGTVEAAVLYIRALDIFNQQKKRTFMAISPIVDARMVVP